jgi:Eukaryotic mitochondrial regulator protein
MLGIIFPIHSAVEVSPTFNHQIQTPGYVLLGMMTRSILPDLYSTLSLFTSSLTSSTAAAKQCPACKQPWRQFSSTPQRDLTKLRRTMFSWLETRGKTFESHVENQTNYLTGQDASGARWQTREEERSVRPEEKQPPRPFPLNRHFFSQPILSENLREEIWRRVKVDKKSVRSVSVELGVEMRRVGAVVRLVELEKQWRAEVSSPPCSSVYPSFSF